MLIWIIIFLIIVVISVITTIFILSLNNFNEYIIKIDETLINIDSILKKRFDLLNKSIEIIKLNTNIEGEILPTLEAIRSEKLNNFELDIKLYDIIKEFQEYAEINTELKEIEDYNKIEIELIESEAEIVSLKKYYNDTIIKYNNLIYKFPTSLVATLKGFEEKNNFEIEENSELINNLK